MTTAVAIALADAQATPVTHTFNPFGLDPKTGLFTFEDTSAASAIGNWRIKIALKRPPAPSSGVSSKGRVYRATITLEEPVLETLSNSTVSGILPAPQVAYVPRCFIDLVLPERSSLTDRKSLRKMTWNLMNDANVVAVVENLYNLS
jgi:hypothetical protein